MVQSPSDEIVGCNSKDAQSSNDVFAGQGVVQSTSDVINARMWRDWQLADFEQKRAFALQRVVDSTREYGIIR